jgi:hypothetical protein
MARTVDINASEALQRVTLDIRIVGLKVARFRLWLAALIIRLAGVISGTEIRVEQGRDFDELPPLPRNRSYMMVGGIEVPRQASCRGDSPLFVSNALDWAPKLDFLVDGLVQNEVISYDVDAGYMRVQKHGPDGQPFIVGDEIATEVIRGKIEIRPREKC